MSSSPPADMVRRRPLSLRARLVAALVGLLAVVCVAIGLATTIAVYQFQVRQLDGQLVSAGNRTNAALIPPGDRDGRPFNGGGTPPVQGPGTVVAHIRNGAFDQAQ